MNPLENSKRLQEIQTRRNDVQNSGILTEITEKYSPFIKEFKKRIIRTLIVFVLATIGGFAFYQNIIKFLIEILSLKGINIVFTSPFQFINLAISCGVATGLIFTFPLIIYQILSFLKPALKSDEYKLVIKYIPFSLILFLIGFAFGAIIMKWQIEIFLASSITLGIGNILDISKLLSTVLLTSAFLGIGFQFPIVILVFARLGLVKKQSLTKYRFWIYLASLFFAILLPVDSILADIALSLPLIILFEVTLLMM